MATANTNAFQITISAGGGGDQQMWIKNGGVFVNAVPSVKVSGIWKPATEGWVIVAGVWKKVYEL